VVYAGPTFHDEVASVVACILHNLGYYVVVYIGNGVHFAGMMIPFSGLFQSGDELISLTDDARTNNDNEL
jgi:hypothetical protein